jgi:hypothetical protein
MTYPKQEHHTSLMEKNPILIIVTDGVMYAAMLMSLAFAKKELP